MNSRKSRMNQLRDNLTGILEVIEYIDLTGEEIVHRVPEGGSGEIVLGSQCVVRENQVAIFFRDGRALDMLGPGRHTLTTLNIPFVVNYLKIPFGSKSPFRAEVVFVNLKDFVDRPWRSPAPLPFRDADLGVVRLEAAGKFAFQVAQPQQFVNQIVGTQGLYGAKQILAYLASIITSKLTDVVGEFGRSVLDLPAKFNEVAAATRATCADDFRALGLTLKTVYVTAIAVPAEVEKAMDERASMGAIGNMQAYLQFKAARALGDAAQQSGELGSLTGLGVGLGAGTSLGAVMAGTISQSLQQGAAPAAVGAAQSAVGLPEQFATLKTLVGQQLNVSADNRAAAVAALENLLTQLASPTATTDDVKAARTALVTQFPWLTQPLSALLESPAALQALGRISARSL